MSVVDTTNLARPTDAIRHLVAERIQARLDTVAAEMIKEVQAQIPEYARPLDPTYARTVRRAVEEVLRHLVGLLEHPDRTEEGWRELFHAIGAGEMHEGRSLDSVHAALRLCTRVGWRWLVDFAAAEGAPLHTLGALAETIFSFLDQVADACAAGYAQAQAAVAGELDRRRRRLLELLLADPPASAAAVAAAAATALAGLRAAVGPAVATADAVKSLRWARDALALAGRGILPGDELIWCEDHLATLAVFRDQHLLTLLAARRLAPLDGLRASQRDLLTGTLLAWLQLDKNATEVAAQLHVHPQTVRYRLRQLDRLFGPALRDPRTRFELEIALRADRARRLSTDDK